MAKAPIQVPYVILDPVPASQVPNGALFLDASNGNAATIKTTGGSDDVLNSSDTFFIKSMIAGGAFVAGRPLSKRPDGKVVDADSDGIDTQNFIGYSRDISGGDGSTVSVLLAGANLIGVLTGLGFTTGDIIYLSETGGYTNDPGSFTGDDDTIVKLGIADSANGVASATAVDLIAITDVLMYP